MRRGYREYWSRPERVQAYHRGLRVKRANPSLDEKLSSVLPVHLLNLS